MDDRFVSRPTLPPASPLSLEHGWRRAVDHVSQRELVALSLLLRPEAQAGDGR